MEKQIKLIQEGSDNLKNKEATLNVTVNIQRPEGDIKETVSISANKNSSVLDLSILSVKAFNKTFEKKNIPIKFNEDSLSYKLLTAGTQNNTEINRNTKPSELDTTDYILEYNPQDILFNFRPPKRCCCCLCSVF